MRHTKEPWSFSEGVGMLKGPDGRYIIGTTENNRRIVACVNASAGLPGYAGDNNGETK